MQALLEQLKGIWGTLSPARRWTAVGVLAAVMAGFVWLITSQTTDHWKTVARSDSPEESKAAVEALRAQQIAVRMGDDGALEVPEEAVAQARLEIANLSAAGNLVGMEIFDEPKFGTTQFQDQVNYIRALEGELSRTVSSVEGVRAARVHLAIPQKQLFIRDQKEPTASVKLELAAGARLGHKQAAGLQWMVASAIEGMTPSAVTILDQNGSILAGPGAANLDNGETAAQLRRRYEEEKKQRVLELLTPIFGENGVRVDVTATMDFSQVKETVTDIDPEKQTLRQEKTLDEQSTTTDKVMGGVVGQAGNDPQNPQAGQQQGKELSSAKKEATRQWDNATTITQRQETGGRLTQLNIGVVIDGVMKDGEEGEATWAPRTPEEIEKITELVKSGAGIRTERGDQLSVVCVQFQDVAVETPAPAPPEMLSPMMQELVKYGVLLLMVLALVFGVLRPFLKASKPQPAPAEELARLEGARLEDELYGRAEGVAAGELGPASELVEETVDETSLAPVGERLRLQAIEATTENPERAVAVIRAWLLMET